MDKTTDIKLFKNKKVRSVWDAESEKWYISIVDVIEVLTESDRPRKYWDDLKRKLRAEGSELSEKIGQLKMPAPECKVTWQYPKKGNRERIIIPTISNV